MALVGRDAELARIDALLAAARAGTSGALVVRGEPGIGKTSLLAEAQARADGFLVLRTVGVESEAELPHAAMHGLLRPLLAGADGLPEPQAQTLAGAFGMVAGPPADRFLPGVAVLSLLADSAEERPLLCLLDDAQWFDRASAEVLGFAARRLGAEGVALLFGARDEGRPVAVGIEELRPQRLSAADAHALLAGSALGASARAAVVVDRAGGNPLALLELAARGPGGDAGPVSGVERAFLARIEELPAAARTALVLAACDPDVPLAADAAALEPAERAGLVRVTAGQVEFRHPLVRSAAYGRVTAAERRRAHAALAAALAGTDPDRRRDAATLDELTPQELQIARLVAGGRTNRDVAARLFVSPKTVEYHLGKVFAKLAVSSRTELARLASEGAIG